MKPNGNKIGQVACSNTAGPNSMPISPKSLECSQVDSVFQLTSSELSQLTSRLYVDRQPISMQGYLMKRKRLGALKLFSCYTKRFFILNADDLIFTYANKEGVQPKEVIPMTVSSLIRSVQLVF